MTFRPRSGDRWIYPFVIGLVVTVLYLTLMLSRRGRGLGCLPFLLGLTGILVVASARTWSSVVILEEQGVRWRGNGTKGFLLWNVIGKIDYDRTQNILVVGLVEQTSSKFHPLPFMTSDLYRALTVRIGPGPKEIDGQCLLL